MRVKLIRKFANALNGVDLSSVREGDTLDVKPHEAALLVGEGWAELLEEPSPNTKPKQKSG
jgi:hypothetical protein